MSNQQKIVVTDKEGKVIKTYGEKASLEQINEIKELAEKNEGALITSQAGDQVPVDKYRPIGISVNFYKTDKGKVEGKDLLKDTIIVVQSVKPSDYNKNIVYEYSLFNKDLHVELPVKEKTLLADDTDTIVEKKDPEYFYCEIKTDLDITVDKFKANYLVQIRRKKDETNFSEWGTQLHTEFALSGMGSIFGAEVAVGYSSRDESVGLKEGAKFKIQYANITKAKIGENLPKRIFETKPESSLMGMAVEVSRLKYSNRSKNFSMALSLKSNDIDISTPEKELEISNSVYNEEWKDVASIPEANKEAIKNLKKNGIQLFEGIYIKEINFELDITDENPAKK